MNNIPELRKIIADAPDHTAINVAHYDYGDLMHLLYLNCENEFYDSDEKRWVEMCLVDNYFHGHRKLSDLRTIIEKTEENQALKAKVAELEQELNNMSHLLDNYDFVNCLNGKELKIRDLEQQAKGLENYAKESCVGIDGAWMVAKASKLRKKAKQLKEQEHE